MLYCWWHFPIFSSFKLTSVLRKARFKRLLSKRPILEWAQHSGMFYVATSFICSAVAGEAKTDPHYSTLSRMAQMGKRSMFEFRVSEIGLKPRRLARILPSAYLGLVCGDKSQVTSHKADFLRQNNVLRFRISCFIPA